MEGHPSSRFVLSLQDTAKGISAISPYHFRNTLTLCRVVLSVSLSTMLGCYVR